LEDPLDQILFVQFTRSEDPAVPGRFKGFANPVQPSAYSLNFLEKKRKVFSTDSGHPMPPEGRRLDVEVGDHFGDGREFFPSWERREAGLGNKIKEEARGEVPVIVESAC
jgi:hypothetical protein